MKIHVFMPCYNEEENITALIEAWLSHAAALSEMGYTLIIRPIDDCSTDNTLARMNEASERHENVKPISHKINKNLRGGLNTAISEFMKTGTPGDMLVLMDGDNTHDPKYIFDLLEKRKEGADCVICSRYCERSDIVGLSKMRIFMSGGARYYYSILLRVPNVRDYTCGYRLYTYDIIKKLTARFGDEPIKEPSFACMMEFLYKLHLTGTRFDEVGFTLRYDYKKGASKMRVLKTVYKSLIVAIKLRFGKQKRSV